MSEISTILGLDPSTQATGWAVLALDGGGEGVLASGVYHPRGGDHDRRLLAAWRWTRGCITLHRPDLLAIETPFYKLNARTLVVLAQLGAAFRLAATEAGIPVVEVAPAKRCTGIGLAGNANKAQVLYTVNAVYGLNLADHNEADAVAIAAAAALDQRRERMARDG